MPLVSAFFVFLFGELIIASLNSSLSSFHSTFLFESSLWDNVLFTIGGALKATDIDTLWVHVTCAWFRPEVSFASDEQMEPAMGVLSIPSSAFVKVFSEF